ncbi:hypothetical protein AN948_05205 [Rhodococcus sp. ADH]|nr:hypothetical protein AN948_05205 [Rhodococcus sp. ADH]RGP48050.1 hypothetical protein AWH04_16675 [Rhodococcus erythropolis]
MTITVDLPVNGRRVLVVGSSSAAISKATALVRAEAKVMIVTTTPTPILSELSVRGAVDLRHREFQNDDLALVDLVFACSGDPALDTVVAIAARNAGVFCVSALERTGDTHPSARAIGSVTLVGGGPGDPGLLTLAGRQALSDADVIITDRLAPVSILADIAPRAEIIDVSKIPGGRQTEQSRINELLVGKARANLNVVRLKGGDGFVFGRGGEEVEHCALHGLQVRVIPGVSSSIAAPASAMIPVTHRGLTQGFTVVSGHVPPRHPDCTVDYRALARTNTTIVLMMAVGHLQAITDELLLAGMSPQTPAAIIADGSLNTQAELRGSLDSIASLATVARVKPPATTVIGAVAGFVPVLTQT